MAPQKLVRMIALTMFGAYSSCALPALAEDADADGLDSTRARVLRGDVARAAADAARLAHGGEVDRAAAGDLAYVVGAWQARGLAIGRRLDAPVRLQPAVVDVHDAAIVFGKARGELAIGELSVAEQ